MMSMGARIGVGSAIASMLLLGLLVLPVTAIAPAGVQVAGAPDSPGASYTPSGSPPAPLLAVPEWLDQGPIPAPQGRATGALAYDIDSDRLVLFGGRYPGSATYD